MGSGHGVVGKPWPAAGRLPGRGRREESGIWVWVDASNGALGQFVTLAGTKDKSGFWVRARDCPRSDLNPKRRRTKLFRIKKTDLSLGDPTSLGLEKGAASVYTHFLKGRGFWLKARIYTV